MNAGDCIHRLRKRWGLADDSGDEFERFRARVLGAVGNSVGKYVLANPEIESHFRMLLGAPEPAPKYSPIVGMVAFEAVTRLTGVRDFSTNSVYKQIALAPDVPSIAEALQTLFWAMGDHLDGLEKSTRSSEQGELLQNKAEDARTVTKRLYERVSYAIKLSPGVDIKLVRRGDRAALYPGGAKVLDEALVEDTLGFLDRHPRIAKRFEHALHTYLGKNPKQVRNLLDDLRFCVEQLLRAVLGNDKSLEKQASTLLPWLKERGLHQEVINMYSDLLRKFCRYQNDAVKHGERWSAKETEFMIYLTGIFMRVLLELESEK